LGGVLEPLLSGVELELELAGGVDESGELAGGVDESELGGVLGGALDCIELSVLGVDVSEPVACCREQAVARASALRLRINKPRFMGAPRYPGIVTSPVAAVAIRVLSL
jgi:hypothetical protein